MSAPPPSRSSEACKGKRVREEEEEKATFDMEEEEARRKVAKREAASGAASAPHPTRERRTPPHGCWRRCLKMLHLWRMRKWRSEASPAQRLFTDGVAIVLSYLPLRDTALALRCCRAWLAAASREPSRGVNWQPHIAEEAEVEMEDRWSSWLEGNKQKEYSSRRLLWPPRTMPRLPATSPLRHHITRVELRRVDWTTLQQLASLPHLQSARLTLDLAQLAEEAKQIKAAALQQADAALDGAVTSQQQRQHIEIDADEWPQFRLSYVGELSLRLLPLPDAQSTNLIPRLLASLRHSPHLSSLTLLFLRSQCTLPAQQPTFDLSPLLALTPRLTELTLVGLQPTDAAIDTIRSLRSLRRIEWSEVQLSEQREALLGRLLAPGCSWTQLEAFAGLHGDVQALRALLPLTASLTDLSILVAEESCSLLPRFRNLRSLSCNNQCKPTPEPWCSAMVQLTHLTQLSLAGFRLDEPTARTLFPPLTQLHTLALSCCVVPDLCVLRLAPALTDVDLSLLHPCCPHPSLAPLQHCARLTRLQLKLDVCELDVSPLAACPTLKHISIKSGGLTQPALLQLPQLKALRELDCRLESVNAELMSALAACRSLHNLTLHLTKRCSLSTFLSLLSSAPLCAPRQVELQFSSEECGCIDLQRSLAAACPNLTSLSFAMPLRQFTRERRQQLQLPWHSLPSLKRIDAKPW